MADDFQYIKLPDGSYGKFAANAKDSDIHAQIAKDFPQQMAPAPGMIQQGLTNLKQGIVGPEGLLEFGKGAAKGALSTLTNIDSMAARVPGLSALVNPAKVADMQQRAQTKSPTQAIGKGAEQAAEFLVPGVGEDAAIARLGGTAAARYGVRAVASGAVNKLQGGSFAGGAVAGGLSEGIAQGVKAVAPSIAETALRVRGADRAYGATPGRAILDETAGITPGSVADSANAKLESLTAQKTALARASDTPVSLQSARDIAVDASDAARMRNNKGTIRDVDALGDQLHIEYGTGTPGGKTVSWDGRTTFAPASSGKPIPVNVSPERAISLQRGVADLRDFSPAARSTFSDAAAGQAYHALGDGINAAVPEIAPLNARTSSLIPVAKRASATDLNAGFLQRFGSRVGAHTGALALGATGFATHGVPGLVAGIALPEVVSSPEFQLAAARGLNSKVLPKAIIPSIRASALQYFRPNDQENQ